MIYYFTYNDLPSGVYRSQVADVCDYIQKNSNQKVKLIALISIRGFLKNRRLIHQLYRNALVLPMYPRPKNWKKNKLLIRLFLWKKKDALIICRGIFSNCIAREIGKFRSVVFDGRGAYAAEFNEYINDSGIADNIEELERQAVLESDFRIAVSHALVAYWQKQFNYQLNDHVVIPCTLHNVKAGFNEADVTFARKKYGFGQEDIVYIYAGSIADWQSKDLMDEFCARVLRDNSCAYFLFLSQFDISSFDAFKIFSNRMVQMWVEPSEVSEVLLAGDYGLMLREESITNSVASPTKYAEYLLAGLKVIMSKNIGDYSAKLIDENLGYIYTKESIGLTAIPFTEKQRLFEFATHNFTKDKFKDQYQKVVDIGL
ncbi:MAG: hypothetical protein HOK65_01895 [Crocinitomicaceae bacterium]|nr:hypothetical protein [Crocinitomicaceae bacterium]